MSYHTLDMSFVSEIAFNKKCIILALYIQAVLYSVFPELEDISHFDVFI